MSTRSDLNERPENTSSRAVLRASRPPPHRHRPVPHFYFAEERTAGRADRGGVSRASGQSAPEVPARAATFSRRLPRPIPFPRRPLLVLRHSDFLLTFMYSPWDVPAFFAFTRSAWSVYE